MTAKQAMQLVVSNQDMPALNYAVNYAKAGLQMDENSHEFKVQCLYVVGNMSSWRATKSSSVTKEEIKEARKVLKEFGKL